MTHGQTSSAIGSLWNLRGFAFDLDGTIWEGPTLLPGAVDLVEDLRAAGIGVVFASNCSRNGSNVLSQRLADLGIVATATEVLTPFDLVGGEVRRRLGPVPVLVIGTDDLAQVLASAGHTSVPIDRWQEAKAVVVGVDLDFTTIASVRPPGRLRQELRSSRSTWMRGSRSGQARSTRAAAALAAGDRRGRRCPTGRDRQAGTNPLPCAIERLGCPGQPGGHGRRQHLIRHRGWPRRRHVHHLARSAG